MTTFPAHDLIRPVPVFLRRLSAVLLLALWLPATLHCSLEHVGLLSQTCAEDCASDQSHAPDGCGTVEDGSYRPTGSALQVATPALYACIDELCLPSWQNAPVCPDEVARFGAFGESRDWISSWQFVRRLAPPSRAPSLAVA